MEKKRKKQRRKNQQKKNQQVCRVKENRPGHKHKDRLFRFIFKDKEQLLILYNALNGTSYDNPDDLEITTLEDVIYMSMKNDVAFLFGNVLNLWEHQSSYNANMPLRGLFYFARLYRQYAEENDLDLFGSTLKKLPFPQYIVFYNGTREEPDRMELKLSDAFYSGEETEQMEPSLEVKVIMLNINLGRNKELMSQCRRLEEYAIFIAKVREYQAQGYEIEIALEKAIDHCIQENILRDILSVYRKEVIEMFLTEYDEQAHMKSEREESFAEGEAEGRAESICQIMELKYPLPLEIKEAVLSERDIDTLTSWLEAACHAQTLDEFLKRAGISEGEGRVSAGWIAVSVS